MTRRRLARVFWLGAAAILVAAALISLVAVLKGSFSDTDANILGTLAALLYCGGAAARHLRDSRSPTVARRERWAGSRRVSRP